MIGWTLALALLAAGAGPARAQRMGKNSDPAPGFGLIYGEGRTDNDATLYRYGFTTRRLEDNDRIGSLSLVYETHTDGLEFSRLDDSLEKDDVELTYESVFAELKRYFRAGGPFLYYWGLRGGYTRVTGHIDRGGGGRDESFTEEQVAPLALLALPFVLEHPGFLLLAMVDGASAGIVLDVVPDHVWLDLQFGSVVIPRHRDRYVALEELFLTSTTLQLVVAF